MQSEKPRAETDEDLAQIVIGHGPCTYLLLSLFMLVIIYPYCKDAGAAGKIILSGLFSMILLGGAYVTRRSRGSLLVGTVLSLISAILHWFALTTQLSIFFRILSVIYIVFLTYTIGSVLRYLLVKGPITADKLHGALAGFIMVAFVWTFIFALLESFAPGSFKIVPVDGAEPNSFYPLLYFSFTTLTTVGFGDIVPVTDQAMSLVILEQLIGVFFVAVLIARLAGLYPPHTE